MQIAKQTKDCLYCLFLCPLAPSISSFYHYLIFPTIVVQQKMSIFVGNDKNQ